MSKPWNIGMVEKWNNGYEKLMMYGLRYLIGVISILINLIGQIQHSNIPLFQYPRSFD
jgi:hypothetical protein